eukprot:3463107-Prymnesium_polylepis.1
MSPVIRLYATLGLAVPPTKSFAAVSNLSHSTRARARTTHAHTQASRVRRARRGHVRLYPTRTSHVAAPPSFVRFTYSRL